MAELRVRVAHAGTVVGFEVDPTHPISSLAERALEVFGAERPDDAKGPTLVDHNGIELNFDAPIGDVDLGSGGIAFLRWKF